MTAVAVVLRVVSYHRGVVLSMSVSCPEICGDSSTWPKLCAERSARFRLLRGAEVRCGRPLELAWEEGVLLLLLLPLLELGVQAASWAVTAAPRFLLG